MAGGRIKGITIEIDGDTKGLNSALKDVNSQTAKTSTELRDVNKLLKLDPGNTELIAQKQELLGKAVESTSEKLSTLKSAQAQVESQFKSGDIGVEQYRSFQREIIATESQLQRFEEGAKGVDDALNGIDSAAGKAESGFKNIHNSADDADNSLSFTKGAAAGNLLSGLSDKSKDLGGTLISTGLSFQDSQSKIQAALGLTDGQAKNAMDSVHGVFDSGLVDSADEATQAVIATKNSFQNLDGIQLTNMTNSLLQISQVTGNDIEDTANAASQAMKGFGISGDEATDVVAKGLQMGLDKNHDFLDTMNEYSPTFKDAGLNAQQMLSAMNAGMKNGSFNTDKAADAVKEFNLRLTSGQLDEPMKKFSMATQDVFQQFKNGQATSADVMASVGNDLKGMPADQAKAAVQGLGTQFEDMGQKSSAALLMATDGVVKTDGAAKSMNKDSPGKNWQSAINSLKDSFSSLLEVFTPVIKMLADVMKGIAGLGQPMKTVIGLIGGAIVALGALAPVMLTLKTSIDVFNGMSAAVKKFAEITKLASAATKVWSAIQVVFNAIMALNPLTLFIIAIAAVIAIIAIVITKMHAWGEIADWLKDVWNGIKDFFCWIMGWHKTSIYVCCTRDWPVLTKWIWSSDNVYYQSFCRTY